MLRSALKQAWGTAVVAEAALFVAVSVTIKCMDPHADYDDDGCSGLTSTTTTTTAREVHSKNAFCPPNPTSGPH